MPIGDIYTRRIKNKKEEIFWKIFGKKNAKNKKLFY